MRTWGYSTWADLKKRRQEPKSAKLTGNKIRRVNSGSMTNLIRKRMSSATRLPSTTSLIMRRVARNWQQTWMNELSANAKRKKWKKLRKRRKRKNAKRRSISRSQQRPSTKPATMRAQFLTIKTRRCTARKRVECAKWMSYQRSQPIKTNRWEMKMMNVRPTENLFI